MRVYELAKELNMPSKQLLEQLHALGIKAAGHTSNLDDDGIKRLKDSVQKPAASASPAPAPAEPTQKTPARKGQDKTQDKTHEKTAATPSDKGPGKVTVKSADESADESAEKAPAKPQAKSSAPATPPAKAAVPAQPAAPVSAGLTPDDPKADIPKKEEPLSPILPISSLPGSAARWAPVEEEFTPHHRLHRPPAARKQHPKGGGIRNDRDDRKPDDGVSSQPVGSKSLVLRGIIIVKELAEKMGLRPNQLIADLMAMNIFAAINDTIDIKVARQVAEKRGFTLDHERKVEEHRLAAQKQREVDSTEEPDRPEDLVPRPPVVTFMGHVDHGKTSLLDKIRNTRVAAGESGGITQHIGAYTVQTQGSKITFLDTPGHAAFTAMRARGAKLTDIAVIIIAADDGIMPQTKEAISHARAAGVAIMVAVNKIDLPAANPINVMRQLQGEGLSPEDWGGQTICCSVSAATGQGIDHLLEMIHLQAEVLELKANPKRRAKGYVIEAQLEPGMGPTATLLVSSGTLNVGDVVLCGRFQGKVKALINDHGLKVKSAPPSTPVKCLGLSGVPEAGMEFTVCADERTARDLAEQEGEKLRTLQIAAPKKVSLENLFERLDSGDKKELKIILKADTQGSVEAIIHALQGIKSDKVSVSMILSGTGNVTANDVMLAAASQAVILGFHVSKEQGVDSVARHEGVEIRMHQIIYAMVDEVRDAMTGLLAPKVEERMRGQAEIRQVFPLGKRGRIAGCMVISGYITPKLRVRVKRGKEILHEASGVASLKRFQDDSAQVKEGQECGIRLENFVAFEEKDILEFYEIEKIKQTL